MNAGRRIYTRSWAYYFILSNIYKHIYYLNVDNMAENRNNKSEPIELLLSILVAISIGFALEKLIMLNDLLWFGFSILAILLAVGFIYIMLNTSLKNKFRDLSRLAVIIFVIFFPFTLTKALQNSIGTIFNWKGNKEITYSILMGLAFISWGISELENSKTKGAIIIVIGGIIAIVSIIFLIMLKGGLINVG